MIWSEIKKVLFIYKGIILIIISAVLTVTNFNKDNSDYVKLFVSDDDQYITSIYQGKVTEEKYNEISAKFDEYNLSDNYMELVSKFRDGEISSVELTEKAKESNSNRSLLSAYSNVGTGGLRYSGSR